MNGINFHYLEYPAAGPDVFLLHGLGSSTYSWEETAPRLQAAGFQVYALDLKGSGWSDKPVETPYDLFTLRDEVIRWWDTLGLQWVIFVGNSLGGSLGLLLALEQPERISRLVLIAAGAYITRLPWVFRLARLPFANGLSKWVFRRWVIKLAMRQAFYNPDRITEARVTAYHDRLRSPGCLEAQIALVRALNFERLSRYDDLIPTIDIPTLLIWGEQDPWIPLSVGRRLKKALPHSTLQVIPHCGHAPQEEQPDETAAIIKGWLKGELMPCPDH